MEPTNTRILFFGYDCTKDSVVFNAANLATLLYGFIVMIVALVIDLPSNEANRLVLIAFSAYYILVGGLGFAVIRKASPVLLRIYLAVASLAVLMVGVTRILYTKISAFTMFVSVGKCVVLGAHVCGQTDVYSL